MKKIIFGLLLMINTSYSFINIHPMSINKYLNNNNSINTNRFQINTKNNNLYKLKKINFNYDDEYILIKKSDLILYLYASIFRNYIIFLLLLKLFNLNITPFDNILPFISFIYKKY
jgi:hypothetical protein